MKLHRTAFFALTALAALATSSARAEFTITIADAAAGYNQTFVDNDGFFDTNDAVGQITFDATRLNADLTTAGSSFRFSAGFGGDSNSTDPNITTANLSMSGTVTRVTSGTGTISVTLLDDAFDLPVVAPGTMTSAASQTYGGNGAGASRTFQSIFNGGTSTDVLTFDLSTGNNSSDGNDVGVDINGQFSLSNVSNFTLSGNGAFVNFTGTTTVTAVPEPASLALMMMGGSALALRLRRRKLA